MNPEQIRHNAAIEDDHWWFAARRTILRDLAHTLVPPSPAALVIDVGCGTGGNAGALADEYRVVGIDASPEAIAFAAERHPRATFRCGDPTQDLADLIPDARLVLMMDVIEHVEDDFAFFSNVVARTRPNAFVLVTVPADPKLWSRHDVASLHWRRYEIDRLRRVWHGLPFEELLVTPYVARVAKIVRAVRLVNNLRGRTSGDAGTDLKLPGGIVNRTLRSFMEGERGKLRRALEARSGPAYRDGISLMAVLRRIDGACAVRTKPADVPRDVHRPE